MVELYELTIEYVKSREENLPNFPFFIPYKGPSSIEVEKANLEGYKYVACPLTGSVLYKKGLKELSLEEIMFNKNNKIYE